MPAPEGSDREAARAKLPVVHEKLCATYQCPIAYFHNLDPLSELVYSLLSHRTKSAQSTVAFKALRARYRNWSVVRDAPTRDVQETIAAVTWPEQKAPRLQQVLRQITALRGGELSLDFLGAMDVPAARAWLEQLSGVGPKTSAAVLAFSSLRKAALPVDSHHHRVAVRLGLIDPGTSLERAHEILESLLPKDWTPRQVYDHHEVMMLHGQRCCYFHAPACPRCAVLAECPVGQVRTKLPQQERSPRAHGRDDREAEKSAEAAPRESRSRKRKEAAPPPAQQGFLFPELEE